LVILEPIHASKVGFTTNLYLLDIIDTHLMIHNNYSDLSREVVRSSFFAITLLLVYRTSKRSTADGLLTKGSGERALETALITKVSSRGANYPIPTRRGSDNIYRGFLHLVKSSEMS